MLSEFWRLSLPSLVLELWFFEKSGEKIDENPFKLKLYILFLNLYEFRWLWNLFLTWFRKWMIKTKQIICWNNHWEKKPTSLSKLRQVNDLHCELAQRYVNWYKEQARKRNTQDFFFLSTKKIKKSYCYNFKNACFLTFSSLRRFSRTA